MIIIKGLIGLLIMVYVIKGLKSFMPKIKIDMDFIGMAICFIGLIVLYCMYS